MPGRAGRSARLRAGSAAAPAAGPRCRHRQVPPLLVSFYLAHIRVPLLDSNQILEANPYTTYKQRSVDCRSAVAAWAACTAASDFGSALAATLQLLRTSATVVCRCNFDVQQRSHWLRLADGVGGRTMSLRLATPVEECRRRAFARTDHPTLNGYAAASVIERYGASHTPRRLSPGHAANVCLLMQQACCACVMACCA